MRDREDCMLGRLMAGVGGVVFVLGMVVAGAGVADGNLTQMVWAFLIAVGGAMLVAASLPE